MSRRDALRWIGDAPKLNAQQTERLVERARTGDRRAADALMRVMAKMILRLARKRADGDDSLADELFSEGLRGAYVAVSKKHQGNVFTYAFVAARRQINKYVNRVRNHRRQHTSIELMQDDDDDSGQLASSEPSHENVLISHDRHHKIIERALRDASPIERKIIRARYGSEESPTLEEIRQTITKKDGTRYTLRGMYDAERRAHERIRTAIETDPDFDPE